MNLFDPATGNPNGAARLSFANNVVPTSRFHPVAKGLLPMMPGANAAGFTYDYSRGSIRGFRKGSHPKWHQHRSEVART